jgi:hypothetical protein
MKFFEGQRVKVLESMSCSEREDCEVCWLQHGTILKVYKNSEYPIRIKFDEIRNDEADCALKEAWLAIDRVTELL